MCGIIGYVGPRTAKDLLLQGLERLEYRGYDSAGLALAESDGLDFVRAVGNLQHLKDAAGPNSSCATMGGSSSTDLSDTSSRRATVCRACSSLIEAGMRGRRRP